MVPPPTQRSLLAHLEATLYFKRSKFTCTYLMFMLFCASKFAIAKIECSFENWQVNSFGWGGTIYFAWYIFLTFFTLGYSTYTKSHCTIYRKVFHVRAVNMISKCRDIICKQGQALSFCFRFSRLSQPSCRAL